MNMGFCANETLVGGIIKEGAFGRTYFRDIYSAINGKWYRKYCSKYYDVSVNKYGVK